MSKELLLEWFKSLSKESVAIAGGKGASLGELTRAGIPVPNGYVILSDSFEKFLTETDLNVELDSILDQVNHKEMQSIENASEEIKALIMNAKMPKDIEKEIVKDFKILDSKFVAVRSSATSEDSSSAAWAGQLDSFLNTTNKTLLENVKRCWASLFTPRAIFYRFEKGLHDTKISVAVVVQKMVESEVSGIAFSVHPVTQDRNQLIIEAGFGLGEAIVSGQITPDSYVVEKVPRRIIDKNVSNQERGLFKIQTGGNEWKSTKENGAQQKLTDKQILELSEIILHIEKHYGFPCDIEWAFEKGKFYIVQSRPITTLTDKSGDKEMPSVVEEKEAQGDLSKVESLLRSKKEIQQVPGYILPLMAAAESTRVMQEQLGFSYPHFLFQYENDSTDMGYFFDDLQYIYAELSKKHNKDKNYYLKVKKMADKEFNKVYSSYLKKKTVYFKSKTKELLLNLFDSVVDLTGQGVGAGHLIEAVSMTQTHPLKDMLSKKIKDPKELAEALNVLTLPEKNSFITNYQLALKKAFELKDKKKKEIALKKVLELYYWVGNGYSGKKELTLEDLLVQKGKLSAVKEQDFSQVRKLKQRIIKKYGVGKDAVELANLLAFLTVFQDERKEHILRAIDELGVVVKEVAREFNIDEKDLLLLAPSEVKEKKFLQNRFKEEITERGKYSLVIYSNDPKEGTKVFFGEEAKKKIKHILEEKNQDNIDSIYGTCASTGKAVGRVEICRNLEEINNFKEGCVLVASMTRPEYLPAMKKSVAIVTDEGGLTSHAAIVARELGVPCVIGTKNASKILQNGDLVEVRANHGQVIIIQRATEETKVEFKKKSLITDLTTAKEFLETNSFDIKEAKCSLFVGDTIFREYGEKNCFGESYSPLYIPYSNNVLAQVILDNKMKTLERMNWGIFINDKKRFDLAIRDANTIQKNIDSISLNPTQLSKLSDKQLLDYLEKLEVLVRKWWRFGFIGEEKGLVVEEKIVPVLIKKVKFSPEEAREYVMTVTTPAEKSIFNKERTAFLELCVAVLQDEELFDLIKTKKLLTGKKYASVLKKMTDYSSKYFYSRSDFYSAKILDYAGLSKIIVEYCSSTPLGKIVEEKKHLLENHKKLLKDKKKLSKKFVLPISDRKYLEYFSELQLWLDERKLSMLKHFYYLFVFVEEVSKRKTLNYATLSLMDFKELKSVILDKGPNLDLVNVREENAVFIYQEGKKELLFVGDEAKQLKETIYGSNDSSLVLSGTVASKGNQKERIIFGTVRIIFDPSKDSLLDGEILVTSMTRPEFVPIMKKAKAIITDEGGIACHAAIVSRELGIPCIIGTKKATKILHTGDVVEVDTNKGIVKILGKN